MKIRTAKLSEVPFLSGLWEEFMKDHAKIVAKEKRNRAYTKLRKNAAKQWSKFAAKQIRSRNGRVFVAEHEGEIAGYNISYIMNYKPVFELRKIGYICDLFVRKPYRGMKVASMFKKSSLEFFMSKKVKHASIAVYPQNELAHKIYKNWGFHDAHIEMRMKL